MWRRHHALLSSISPVKLGAQSPAAWVGGGGCYCGSALEGRKGKAAPLQERGMVDRLRLRAKGCISCSSLGPTARASLTISDAATREGAKLLDHLFIGCHVTNVACEDASIKRYVGHSDNIVIPLWILKTAKEKNLQRLVHLSSDLARQVVVVLENVQTTQEVERKRLHNQHKTNQETITGKFLRPSDMEKKLTRQAEGQPVCACYDPAFFIMHRHLIWLHHSIASSSRSTRPAKLPPALHLYHYYDDASGGNV